MLDTESELRSMNKALTKTKTKLKKIKKLVEFYTLPEPHHIGRELFSSRN